MKDHIVYMLKCINNCYYTGWTNDFIKRMKAHQNGSAAHYTHAFCPVEVVYIEVFATKSEAMKKEAHIKKMSRAQKQIMIEKHSSFTNAYLVNHPFIFTKRDH